MTLESPSILTPPPGALDSLSLKRPAPASSSEWLTTEIAVLRAVYPSQGSGAVQAQLPHRSKAAIRAKASELKLRCRRPCTAGLRWARKYEQRDDIDTAIREGYIHATTKGAIKALAARLGRPAWWVQKRATSLGVTRSNRTRVDCWLGAELAIVEQWSMCTPKLIASKLKRAGYRRTEGAVAVKLKRMQYDRDDPNRWTATALAPLLGVNAKTVADWIERRDLPATREVWGPHGRLMIERKRLRAWINDHRRLIDLRRVDQPWFMDLVFGPLE